MNTRKVIPCGFLTTVGCNETFLLLSPEPVAKDSWQNDGTYRFVVVPCEPDFELDENGGIYSYARHLVTNSFAIEYRANLRPIEVQILDETDITKTEFMSTEEKQNYE